MNKTETLKDYFSEEKARKVFEKVFDEQTILALHKIAKKGYFDFIEFVVSTGKEAHVFRGQDKAGNFRAVKIYKIKTSDFKNMEKYIKGDFRFKKQKRTKKDIVFTWAKKEFKNLRLAIEAGASVPLPIHCEQNILVMEFVGNEKAASPLKEITPSKQELESFYQQTIEFIARIFFRSELIHADLSDYNILVKDKKLFFIDMGQAVLSSHPKAKDFFERDIKNMANYFSKHGLKTSFEQMLGEIKAAKTIYKKE